jgi:serine/threonine protein kinase
MKFKDKYTINKNKILGYGKYSKVYLGYEKNSDNVCAIKRILINSKLNISNLKKEIDIMHKIKNNPHPNIIKCLDIFEEDKYVYIVLEYCSSGDLSKLIKMPIQERFVKFYFIQFNKGIEYLRSNNIYHRDLKPKNILITNNFKELKIADFGLSNFKNEDGSICGSPLYMAPELINKIGYSDKTDLWSIGLILYEMLYGQHPYDNCKNYDELLTYSSDDFNIIIPPLNNNNIDVSPECINLLKSLLEKNISKRITWKKFIKHGWFKNYKDFKKDEDLSNKYCKVSLVSDLSDLSDLSDSSDENNLFELELS